MNCPWIPMPMWKNGECFILGGGASLPFAFGVPAETVLAVYHKEISPAEAYSSYLEPIFQKHVIGINEAYNLGDWVDFLFFGDNSWYLNNKERIKKWRKIKVSCSPLFLQHSVPGIKFMERDAAKRQGISTKPGAVAWNFHSGGAAINLAVHLGVKRIYLLGFDMKPIEVKGHQLTHWHSFYVVKDRPKKMPPFNRHLASYEHIARDAQKMGIEIYNLNPNSAISYFPFLERKW